MTGNPETTVNSVVAEGSQYIVATANGCYKNKNGGNILSPSNDGLLATTVTRMLGVGNQLLSATANGIWRSFDTGENWVSASPQAKLKGTIELKAKGDTLCAFTPENLFFSTDAGANWKTLYSNNTGGTQGPFWPSYGSAFALDGNRLLAATDFGFYKSDSFGYIWEKVTDIPDFNHVSSLLAVNGHYLGMSYWDGILRSKDQGQTWEHVNPNTVGKGRLYYFDGRVFAVSLDSVQISDNFGDSWEYPIGLPIFGPFERQLPVTVMAAKGNVLYAGVNYGGIYKSTDNGSTWALFSDALPNPRFQDLIIHGNTIFASCTNAGIWRSDLGTTSARLTQAREPLSIWPNPVNQETATIDWPNTSSEKVIIKVSNGMGQCVMETTTHPKQNQLNLSVSSLKPGIYQILCSNGNIIRSGNLVKL